LSKLKLTRENILNGTLHASARELLGPGVRFMTEEERKQSVHAMLALAPKPERIWVFGYGSRWSAAAACTASPTAWRIRTSSPSSTWCGGAR
jgi:hypothetical protein